MQEEYRSYCFHLLTWKSYTKCN